MKRNKSSALNAWVCVVALLTVLAVMTGSAYAAAEKTASPKPPAKTAATKTPLPAGKPTGTLTIAMSSLHEETFLPWNGGGPRKFYLDTIYEYLVYINPETRQLTPGLATKWEMSQDGKTWTFAIRKGVQFHEGNGELTAEDVKYSIDRVTDPKSILGISSTLRKLVNKVEAPEKYKLVVTLNEPDIEFDSGYMSNGLGLAVVCKKYVESKGDEAANAHPIGTGPFTLAEHKKGISVKLKAIDGAERHWRARPEFQNITFLAVPEESTRIAMLKTGEADMAPINYDSINAAKEAGFQIFAVKNNWVPVIRFGGLNKTNPKFYNPKVPWNDKRVRQAMNYAVDRQALVKNIFQGLATPAGMDTPDPVWLSMPAYPYDPVKAKQLLAEAGYPNGFEITLKTFTTTPGAELPTIGEAVGMFWQAIGLKVKIEPTDWTSLRGAWTGGKATDFVWTHRGLTFTSPMPSLDASFSGKSLFASYATEETDAKLKEIAEQLDRKKRTVLLRKMGEYLRDEAACVFLVFASEPYAASRKLGKWSTISEYASNFDLVTRAKK